MFPVFNNFFETPGMKVDLDVRIHWGRGKLRPQTSHLPPPKKVFPEKIQIKAISNI